MAKYQVYPPEVRDHGVKVHWVRIIHDDGSEHIEGIYEKPGFPLSNPSPVQRGGAVFSAWLQLMAELGTPQTDGGRMLANDPDYNQ